MNLKKNCQAEKRFGTMEWPINMHTEERKKPQENERIVELFEFEVNLAVFIIIGGR